MSELIGEIIAGDRSGCDGNVDVGVWPWKAGLRPDRNRRDNFRLVDRAAFPLPLNFWFLFGGGPRCESNRSRREDAAVSSP